MELKGIIKVNGTQSLTCCVSVPDVYIDGVSLYDKLDDLFGLDPSSYDDSPQYSVKYVILDEPPTEDKSFDELSCEIMNKMIYGEHVSGCYSEWTCGYGGFDYVVGGHSIFEELKTFEGKYIHFEI